MSNKMTDLTAAHNPLDGWCNFHQCIHEEDRGKDASPSRHAHLDPDLGKSMFEIWMRDNPECWGFYVNQFDLTTTQRGAE